MDSNHGPTDCKIFTSRVGLSLTVAGDVTNLTPIPVSKKRYASKTKMFVCNRINRRSGTSADKWGVPLGWGLGLADYDVGGKVKLVFLLADNAEIPLRSR